MGKIINFHDNPVSSIKKELKEKEKELEKTRNELAFFKSVYSSSVASSDLLKLHVADLEMSILLLQGHLKIINENLASVKSKLSQIDKMKERVKTE